MLKAGGSHAYTIGLLVAASLLSVVMIPLTMKVFGLISGIPMQMGAVDVFKVVLTSILIPLLIGIAIRALSESIAEKIVKPVSWVGLILLVLAVLPILFTSIRAILTVVGDGTLMSLAAFAIIGLILGHLLRWTPLRESTCISTRHFSSTSGGCAGNYPCEFSKPESRWCARSYVSRAERDPGRAIFELA